MKKLLSILLLFPLLSSAQPVANAGGTYIVYEDPHGSGLNNTFILDGSGSTGSNLKYQWYDSAQGYYSNNVSTLQTNTGQESSWLNIKQQSFSKCALTQLWLGTDSVRKFLIGLKVTDSVSGLSSRALATVIFRCRKDYPYQNIDGSKGFHYWGTNPSFDNAHVPFGIPGDVVKTGATADPVNDASGTAHNMSDYIYPTWSDTFHILNDGQNHTVWYRGGHYRTIACHGDTLGGSGMQLGGIPSHPFKIRAYDTCLVTDDGFELSNPMYGECNGGGVPGFPGAFLGYAYTEGKYGMQFSGNFEYIGGACMSIDGVSTRWFTVDSVEICNGHADGLVIKQDNISGHSNFTYPHVNVHDCYIHHIFQEGLYYGSSVNGELSEDSGQIYNIRATWCGDKGIKTISLGTGMSIHNNVVWACGLNAYSPFEANVPFPREIGFYNRLNTIYRELIAAVGGSDQVVNVINQDPPNETTVIGENKISNMVVVAGHGYANVYVGGPYDNTSPIFTTHFDSCYFGQTGRFNGADVYTSGAPASNSVNQVNAQPGGGSSLKDSINFTNNIYDNTKNTLFGGNANVIQSGNSLVSLIAYPQFANVWMTPGTQVKYYVDTIYGTYRNEFGGQSGTKQGQLYTNHVGDTIALWGLTYICLQNNIGHYPHGVTDAYYQLVQYPNGGYLPPDDVRLYATDPYAKLSIGMTDQLIIGCGNCLTAPINIKFH